MKFPFAAESRTGRGFTLRDVDTWIEQSKPSQIEMDDSQYSWFSALLGRNVKVIEDAKTGITIPIVFLEAKEI